MLLAVFLACDAQPQETPDSRYAWKLPAGFPEPVVPENNPISDAKINLGKQLFFNKQLSANGLYSCADCHKPELAFTDGRTTAIGSTGELHTRNTPSLLNSAYNATLGWANSGLLNLEGQHLIPLFNTSPIEMGLNVENTYNVLERLKNNESVKVLFNQAFSGFRLEALSVELIIMALASYIRTLIVANSAYDQYLYYDDRNAMSGQAIEGMQLFFSDRLKCSECHASFNFSGPGISVGRERAASVFHNTGLYNLNGQGGYPDPGLFLITGNSDDMGAFRAPSLRNVELTAPYMHDGSMASLEEVLDFYARGGRLIEEGPSAGDGRNNPFKRPEISGFSISSSQKEALIAFLKALSSSLPLPT